MQLGYFCAMANLLFQALVLASSLYALSDGKDLAGRGMVTFIEFAGIMVLAVGSTASFQIRREKQGTAEQSEPDESSTA